MSAYIVTIVTSPLNAKRVQQHNLCPHRLEARTYVEATLAARKEHAERCHP